MIPFLSQLICAIVAVVALVGIVALAGWLVLVVTEK